MNIIGDIAGQYDTLMALLKQMPDEIPVSVGDMVDRGPKSKEVLDFFMKNGKAVLGNHEHMMLCSNGRSSAIGSYRYDAGLWRSYNGGGATIESFGTTWMSADKELEVLKPYLDWLETLPPFLIFENEKNESGRGLFVSHAPVCPFVAKLEETLNLKTCDIDDSIVWNRMTPPLDIGHHMFQVFGHNNWQGGTVFKDSQDRDYAMCIDKSRHNVLMGLHWPSMKAFEQPYV